ncbi:MAG: polysaccharide deacetylase family protein [Helicobacteraceae bacterium]|nr:polysaccharide deacetylase family protein [Helicobacteraceae bacterium]
MSLDFELMWGMRDKHTVETYGKNVAAVHTVIPKLLEKFGQYRIHATFATVGLIFFESKNELIENIPANKPKYFDDNLSPYNGYFSKIGETRDAYHYAPQLIKKIREYPDCEIGTHTFSHYYCLEGGQTIQEFEDDLKSAIRIAEKRGIKLLSLVFPRNQFNDEYIKVCNKLGIICYRGNQRSWLYEARNNKDESLFRRLLRFVDSYINLSGHNCYADSFLKKNLPIDVPASRFLRPYSKKLKLLEGLRLKRIKSDMLYAAKNQMTYHLWWHPHNFGVNQTENFLFLEKILQHYQKLNREFGFKSYTMSELTNELSGVR